MTSWNPFPWGKTKKSNEESVNVENYVDSLKVGEDGFIEQDGMIYVKPIDLDTETAIEDVKKEFKAGNIVIADLTKLLKDQPELYKRINAVKKYCQANGGDIARVSQVKIMILPEGMEIAYPSSNEPGEE